MSIDSLRASLADRYRIERELGAGGMATVYLAQDLRHDRQVAIKVLKPELAAVLGAERFVVEIKTTAALQHPHILPLFDSGSAEGFLWYAMPYIEGETLRSRLDRETQLGIDEAVRITREVADALDYAHRHGVVHRDIKPENILLHDGRPMVADFGIALALSAAAGGRMTETGMSLGTPHYMSPEQATADKEITGRSDIYSLASVCYEMLTGEPPHMGNSAQQIIMKIVAEEAQPVTRLRKNVPPNVVAAVARALEKLPADRFATAKEFADALIDPGFRTADTQLLSAPARGRAALLPWLVAAALGVVAVGATVAALRREAPEASVTRFTLELPADQRLYRTRNNDTPFVFSPDGKRIAYLATDSTTGQRQLYLRDLAQLDAEVVRGAADALAPFFSPDGQWIGFFSGDGERLLKVPVAGGPPITLATDVGNGPLSGTWGDDGTITYGVSDGRFSLRRVPGGGGVPVAIPSPDSSNTTMLMPFALPGGRSVLATECTRNCTVVNLVQVDVTTGTRRLLVPGAARGWYIPTGHLVYADEEGAIFAVAFDPRSGTVGTAPVPLLEDVNQPRNYLPRLALSPAGTLIYLPGSVGAGMQLVELDRSGRETAFALEPGRLALPRLSPTGDRVALTVTGDKGYQIWIYSIGNKTLVPLTSVGSNYRSSWSPDGRRVAFVSDREDGSSGIYWLPADGSAPAELVAPDDTTGGTTSWTRDGNWIVFDGSFGQGKSDEDIYAIGTGSDHARRTVVSTGGTDESGTVSPDGRWIAYVSDESGQSQVYVRPFLQPGGRWLVSSGFGVSPLWASDTELLYIDGTSTQRLVSARLAFDPDPRVLDRTPLFDWTPYLPGARSYPPYDLTRDGQRIVTTRMLTGLSSRSPPVVVLDWFAEVRHRVAEQGGTAR